MIYGLNGFKVHSKLCLISRKTQEGVSCITQIGTGNYNEKTSALYTDLSLITANQEDSRIYRFGTKEREKAYIASVCIGEDFAAGEVAFIMQLGGLLEEK